MKTIGTVKVVNVNTYTGDDAVYVGRPSVLGNPYSVRDCICYAYRGWLHDVLTNPDHAAFVEVSRAFNSLVERVVQGDSVVLSCWCSPRHCHADELSEMIMLAASDQYVQLCAQQPDRPTDQPTERTTDGPETEPTQP